MCSIVHCTHAATNKSTRWSNQFIDYCNHTTSPVGKGRSTVTFTSSIIGIFQLKFYTFLENGTRKDLPLEEEVEIVIGRDKVMMSSIILMLNQCTPTNRNYLSIVLNQADQNILVNVFFSLGMGLALLVMGIDIDLKQVMEAVRWQKTKESAWT